MAGTVAHGKIRSADILFDLTPEDDKKLQESDLIQLVNYGQLFKEVEVMGTDGKVYKVELALLWDEDYVDILKKTQSYSEDAILRVKVLRRLKLHKAIQRIDSHQYDDVDDSPAQRELWNILCRMSDAQVEYLDRKYHEIEFERDLSIADAMKMMGDKFEKTAPSKNESTATKSAPKPVADEHLSVFQNSGTKREKAAESVANVLSEIVEGTPVHSTPKSEEVPTKQTPPIAASPKQGGEPV